ncbi:hypothetical protein MMC22_000362 [Lobaria immixta]|nr:hypothetical protein [Lobaria immixta]
MLRSSGLWTKLQEATNPQLMDEMAAEVSSLFSAGRSAPLDFEFLTIEKQATLNVPDSRIMGKFPARIPNSWVAFLAINGPEYLSVMKNVWAHFSREHTDITIYLTCCIRRGEVADRVVSDHGEDGSYTDKVSIKMVWTVISLDHLLEV